MRHRISIWTFAETMAMLLRARPNLWQSRATGLTVTPNTARNPVELGPPATSPDGEPPGQRVPRRSLPSRQQFAAVILHRDAMETHEAIDAVDVESVLAEVDGDAGVSYAHDQYARHPATKNHDNSRVVVEHGNNNWENGQGQLAQGQMWFESKVGWGVWRALGVQIEVSVEVELFNHCKNIPTLLSPDLPMSRLFCPC